MAIPANPAKDARIRLSVKSSRMSRKRPAPIANRMAISRVRASAAQKKSRNVGASHQQDRQRKDHKNHAEFPIKVFSSPRFELGVYRRAAAAIDLRILAFEVFRKHGEFILRLLQRRARF